MDDSLVMHAFVGFSCTPNLLCAPGSAVSSKIPVEIRLPNVLILGFLLSLPSLIRRVPSYWAFVYSHATWPVKYPPRTVHHDLHPSPLPQRSLTVIRPFLLKYDAAWNLTTFGRLRRCRARPSNSIFDLPRRWL